MNATNTTLTLCVFFPLALLACAGALHLIARRADTRRGAWLIKDAQRLHTGTTTHSEALRGAVELLVLISLMLAVFGWLALV